MIFTGIVLPLLLSGVLSSAPPPPPPPPDCAEAREECWAEPRCQAAYQGLEQCGGAGCGQRAEALLALWPPLLACRCQRASRHEEHCLHVYWKLRPLPGLDQLEASPYHDALMDAHLASVMAASSVLQLEEENLCLKAAQDCSLFDKCGARRSEYVLACTKPEAGSGHCNRHKCQRALRRFLERVPEEYSLGLLFCPCTSPLCGERRRKTIVPSCSHQHAHAPQPNCLHLQSFCRRDHLCRSRLADFLHNCQPSESGCERAPAGLCLRAYAGLIGTIMTPNYISNSSTDVSLWCHCDGSGNQWQDCLQLQHMFTHNACLHNAIGWVGGPGSLPVDAPAPPAPRPSSLAEEDELLSNNYLPEHDIVDGGTSEEDFLRLAADGDGGEGGQLDVMPPLSERATVSGLSSSAATGAASAAAGKATPPTLLPLLLLLAQLSLG